MCAMTAVVGREVLVHEVTRLSTLNAAISATSGACGDSDTSGGGGVGSEQPPCSAPADKAGDMAADQDVAAVIGCAAEAHGTTG